MQYNPPQKKTLLKKSITSERIIASNTRERESRKRTEEYDRRVWSWEESRWEEERRTIRTVCHVIARLWLSEMTVQQTEMRGK